MNIDIPSLLKTIEYIKKGVSLIGKIKDLSRRSKSSKYSMEVSEVKDMLELIEGYIKIKEAIEKNPELKKIQAISDFISKHQLEIPEFFKNYSILNSNGEYSVVPLEISDDLLKKLKEGKEKELEEKISIIPLEESQIFDEYKNIEKQAPKSIVDIANQLDTKYKSLITLSIYVEGLYEQKRADEAEEIKFSIYRRYGAEGLKFCNLYIRGYLKTLFNNIYQQQQNGLKIIIDKTISEFMEEKANAIFFIHLHMYEKEIQKVIQKINNFLDQKKEYIAIHSLGINVDRGIEIAKRINPAGTDYTTGIIHRKSEDKPWEFSEIWYRANGIEIYSLIKDIAM